MSVMTPKELNDLFMSTFPDRIEHIPHVTLARLWGKRADERLLNWLAGAAAFAAPRFRVDGFSLFSSALGSGAPAYGTLKTYPARS